MNAKATNDSVTGAHNLKAQAPASQVAPVEIVSAGELFAMVDKTNPRLDPLPAPVPQAEGNPSGAHAEPKHFAG